MIDGTESTAEACAFCGHKYSQRKYSKDENPYFSGWVEQKCPKCKFEPDFSKKLDKILRRNVSIIVSENGASVGLGDSVEMVILKFKQMLHPEES